MRETVINDALLAAPPNKDFVAPETVGALAVFLRSDAADQITGGQGCHIELSPVAAPETRRNEIARVRPPPSRTEEKLGHAVNLRFGSTTDHSWCDLGRRAGQEPARRTEAQLNACTTASASPNASPAV